jgi:hypothetical protein
MQTTPFTLGRGRRARHALAGSLLAAAAITGALASGAQAYAPAPAPPSPWTPIDQNGLTVTKGTIATVAPNATLRTADSGMRAVAKDGGVHAASARIWFRYLGESTTTAPLGSGEIRRQIGLKLRAANPCNLLYVMWHAYPTRKIQVTIKRNPGQTTSAQCGNNGYTTFTEIPLGSGDGTADHGAHVLAARTRRTATGDLALSVYVDSEPARQYVLPAADTAGLEGPIGVRSDNGNYLFQLSGRP